MTTSSHQLARRFVAALADGDVPDELLTPDMTLWTTTSGESDKARFQGGIRLLASILRGPMNYRIESLTAEEDRVVVELQSSGVLINGEEIQNRHVFILRLREGRIASAAEHMNPTVVREKIAPLMQRALAGNPE